MSIRVAFAGTPEFAATILRGMVKAGWDIPLVITQPDAPAGRGQGLNESAVSNVSVKLGLNVVKPTLIAQSADVIRKAKVDLLIVAAYGQILPLSIFTIPQAGTLNVHASLLPKYRGASPVSAAILSGDTETGISLMRIDEGLDTGPVYSRSAIPIAADDTTGSLTARLADLGTEMLIADAPGIATGGQSFDIQDESQANITKLICKQDGRINWHLPAVQIERHIRAMQPWPSAWTETGTARVEILAAEVVDGAAKPGRVDSGGIVGTGNGRLRLHTVKPAGKTAMPATDWLRGLPSNPKFDC